MGIACFFCNNLLWKFYNTYFSKYDINIIINVVLIIKLHIFLLISIPINEYTLIPSTYSSIICPTNNPYLPSFVTLQTSYNFGNIYIFIFILVAWLLIQNQTKYFCNVCYLLTLFEYELKSNLSMNRNKIICIFFTKDKYR